MKEWECTVAGCNPVIVKAGSLHTALHRLGEEVEQKYWYSGKKGETISLRIRRTA